jgi:hypothetical protein
VVRQRLELRGLGDEPRVVVFGVPVELHETRATARRVSR